jgi:hypothetical protein
MICPFCTQEIGFLFFKKDFECPACNRNLKLKRAENSYFFEMLVTFFLLEIIPIPKSGVFSVLVPAFCIVAPYLFYNIRSIYIEPGEE